MTIINTVEYRMSLLQGRFMVEEHLNGHYDSFRRARLADMKNFVGDNYPADLRAEATYTLTLTAQDKWILATLVDGVQVRSEFVSASKVRNLFNALAIEFRIRTIGENVTTNYEFRSAA